MVPSQPNSLSSHTSKSPSPPHPYLTPLFPSLFSYGIRRNHSSRTPTTQGILTFIHTINFIVFLFFSHLNHPKLFNLISNPFSFDALTQTIVLRTSIHCPGCSKKVKRIIQSIPGKLYIPFFFFLFSIYFLQRDFLILM